MKLLYSRQAYEALSPADRVKLTPRRCRCIDGDGEPDADCESCSGTGSIYEDMTVSGDTMRAILDNLRSQGVPIPKGEGTQ